MPRLEKLSGSFQCEAVADQGRAEKAGIPNKRTLELHALAEGQPQPGTPLEFLMGVYCNEALPIELCIDAASKAAPYVHPRLTAGTLAGDTQYPLRAITRIALVPVRPQPRDNLP